MNYYLGFDPGGKRSFGWAVARIGNGASIVLVTSGCAAHAREAIDEALRHVPSEYDPVAAGIDAPLFWTPTGTREVDAMVRGVLRACKAPSPGGTVQQLNSLRGACLVQGVAAAVLLRQRLPNILLTETHPKALLWHLRLAHDGRPHGGAKIQELPHFSSEDGLDSEHERDAVLSCVAAASLHRKDPGWRDLLPLEPHPIHLVPGPVSYWMPDVTDYATKPQ